MVGRTEMDESLEVDGEEEVDDNDSLFFVSCDIRHLRSVHN
jgi:hypothetical protein